TATSALSLHDALPIYDRHPIARHQVHVAEHDAVARHHRHAVGELDHLLFRIDGLDGALHLAGVGKRREGDQRRGYAEKSHGYVRSEEHTSELQSRENL